MPEQRNRVEREVQGPDSSSPRAPPRETSGNPTREEQAASLHHRWSSRILPSQEPARLRSPDLTAAWVSGRGSSPPARCPHPAAALVPTPLSVPDAESCAMP